MTDTEELASVSSVSLQLPPFWHSRPQAWFAHIEAAFELQKITSQKTKYNYVVVSLTPELADVVEDIIRSPPTHEPYTTLKDAILKRTSLSDHQRSQELFKNLERGDRTPSQLYRHMRNLLGDKHMDDSLFRQLWLSKLPPQVQASLASVEDLPLERQAAIADAVFEAIRPTVSSVSTQPDIMTHIEQLYKEVMSLKHANLHSNPDQQPRSRPAFRDRSRRRSRSRTPSKGYCWYHSKFGPKARRCLKLCSFEGPLAPSTSGN